MGEGQSQPASGGGFIWETKFIVACDASKETCVEPSQYHVKHGHMRLQNTDVHNGFNHINWPQMVWHLEAEAAKRGRVRLRPNGENEHTIFYHPIGRPTRPGRSLVSKTGQGPFL